MNRFTSKWQVPVLLAAGLCAFVLLLSTLSSAQSTGTVTGTVADQSGAVVAKAKVSLKNEGTGDTRETTSNDSGYFSFGTVNPGNYTVKVTAANFKSFERKGLSVLPGDVRDVHDIALQVGTSSDVIEVTGVADEIVPTDSGERSAVLTSKQIENLSLEGRDATELVRTLPGFAVYNGLSNQAQDNTVLGPGSSSVGTGYVGNGANYRGGSDLTLDGAHILDNGCNCGSTTTVNGDMVSEVKVQTSNFGADSAKGPVVVNAVGKSGTTSYHGEAYLYARDQALNSLDWAFKHQMILNNASNPLKISPPASKFLYPGLQIGGPVPGTGKKLVFHSAFEYYHQAGLPTNTGGSVSGLITDTVPTADMRNGIFDVNPAVSPDNNKFCTSGGNGGSSVCQGTYNSSTTFNVGGTAFPNLPAAGVSYLNYVDTTGTLHQNVMSQISGFDPGGAILMGNIPAENSDPSATGGYNYIVPVTIDQNGWMWRNRVDFNASENTKVYGSYQIQKETDNVPIHLWWEPYNSIPFPGGMASHDNSQTITGHFVKIINPTLTNDFSAALGYINYPLTRNKASAWAKSTGGVVGTAYPYADGPYASKSLMMPQLGDVWSAGLPSMSQPDIFTNGNHFLWQKWNFSLEDAATKSYKTHTIKAGFYYERTVNNQGAFSDYDGNFQAAGGFNKNGHALTNCFNGSTACGADNGALNILLGAGGFDQVNKSSVDNLWYPTYSGYVQDDWKATKRLTLNLGLRADHLGAWTPPNSLGIMAFNGNANTPTIPYFTWHGETPSIPLTGRSVAAITWEPRLGLAYDLRGNGKTVLRGGWGEYGYRDQWNDYAGPADTPQGVNFYSANFPVLLSFTDYSGTQSFGLTGAVPSGIACGPAVGVKGTTCGSVTGQLLTDHQQPITRNYNFTISQQMPWSSLFEIGYVGAQSRYQQLQGNNQNVDPRNMNAMPMGAALAAVGCTALQASNPNGTCNISSTNIALDPLNAVFGGNAVYVLQHKGLSNYNAMQASWARQKGRISYNLNYTWSKVLGTQGQGGGAGEGLGPDANNLAHDYGILGIDRSHVINLSYTFQTGNPMHGALGYAVNGWNISGITTWQSGGDIVQLAANTDLNLGGSGPSFFDPVSGKNGVYSLNNLTYLGTPNTNIQPTVICNPTGNLKSHQYFNAACFSGPTPGTNGWYQLPYIHGPAYFNSDLAIFKTFKVTERQNVEFRLSAFNFLNHPLDSFQNQGDMSLSMNYQCNGAPASSTNYCPLGSGQYVVTNNPTGAYKLTGSNVATGYASTRFGRRVTEVSAKYRF